MSSSPRSSSPIPHSPPRTSSSKGRKSVKDSTKERTPKPSKSGAPKPRKAPNPKVTENRKVTTDSTSTTSILHSGTKRLTFKLPPPAPRKPKQLFKKHNPRELKYHFIGNLLSYEKGKLSFEIDDDGYNYLKSLCNQFSMNVDFKIPVRKGVKRNIGKFYINATVDVQDDGEDAIEENEIIPLIGHTVEVKGYFKTYDFNADDENGEIKNLKGCTCKVQYIVLPVQSPTGTTPSDEDEVDEEEEQN